MRAPNINILLTLIIVSAASGNAFAKDDFYFAYSEYGQKLKIDLISKANCVSTLEQILLPEKTIETGLQELIKSNAGRSPNERLNCLTDMMESWENRYPN